MTQEVATYTEHLAEHNQHYFEAVVFRGIIWELKHLSPFVIAVNLDAKRSVIVVVLFSCHCFTHAVKHDARGATAIPSNELYENQREIRVLNEERYELSKTELPSIVKNLAQRHITVADGGKRDNFVTIEVITQAGEKRYYGVFFEVEKDKKRKNRMILRVQSAYLLSDLTKRQKNAKKVRFEVLIKAVFEGRKIRP